MATPTKPTTTANANATNANTSDQHHDLHVSWDEETIALHDKDRGTRMKIEEPKTPYHSYGADGEASPSFSLSGKEDAPPMEWSDLQVKLAHVETKQQQQQQQKSEWDSSGDEGAASPAAGPRFAERDAEGKKVEKDPKFAAKRKTHYNEFQAMKMWRQSHEDEEEDEEAAGYDQGKADSKAASTSSEQA